MQIEKGRVGLKQSSQVWFGRFTKILKTVDISKVKEIILYLLSIQTQGEL